MTKIDWRSLASTLGSLTEEQVKHLLDEEINTHRRPAYARRMHQRYASLRTMRERAEIMEKIAK